MSGRASLKLRQALFTRLVHHIKVAANQDVIDLSAKAKPIVAESVITIEDPLQLKHIINELDDWKVGIA